MAVLDIATGKATKVQDVPLNAELLDFCWSPDGKQIAYLWKQFHEGVSAEEASEKETESHLIVCDPDGKNQKTVRSAKGSSYYHTTLAEIDWR